MKSIKYILILLALCATERFCHHQTHGFRLHKIASTLEPRPEWQTTLPKQLQNILSQPFYFLDSGGECYVFLSQDSHYVLKFFKHHHMREHAPFDLFSTKWKKARQTKLESLFQSCLLAHDRLKQETGLIALHLCKTQDHFPQKLTLYGPLKTVHTIDLDQTEFALQRRATLATDALKACRTSKEAEPLLDAILTLIKSRCAKGIADRDPVFKRNLAFIDGRAIAIDLGAFTYDEALKTPNIARRTLFFETLKLRRYLSKNAPNLLPYFELKLSEELVLLD